MLTIIGVVLAVAIFAGGAFLFVSYNQAVKDTRVSIRQNLAKLLTLARVCDMELAMFERQSDELIVRVFDDHDNGKTSIGTPGQTVGYRNVIRTYEEFHRSLPFIVKLVFKFDADAKEGLRLLHTLLDKIESNCDKIDYIMKDMIETRGEIESGARERQAQKAVESTASDVADSTETQLNTGEKES